MKKKHESQFNTRQYMVSPDFEIFCYSDLHFKSVGAHSHDYYEFYFFEEGAVTMKIGRESFSLHPGDMLLVPPGKVHRALITDPEKPYRRFVFWMSRPYLERLIKEAEVYGYLKNRAARGNMLFSFDLLSFNTVRSILFSLLEETHGERFGKTEQQAMLIRSLLLTVSRLVYEREEQKKTEIRSAYEEISAYIDMHLDEPLTLDQIAGALFLSKYYIAHLFRENTGMSVHQYILRKRLEASCDFLRSGASVSAALQACGFRDYTAFYRAFLKAYGVTPSAFRETASAGEAFTIPGEAFTISGEGAASGEAFTVSGE